MNFTHTKHTVKHVTQDALCAGAVTVIKIFVS